jgi:hypothetical protein
MLISVTIAGTTPIIFDRFHAGLLEGKSSKTTNQRTEPTPLEQAAARLYVYDGKGKLAGKPYLPATYLFGAIIGAGRFIKVGKRQLSTRDETIVTSFLSIVGTDFPIKSMEGWRVDGRGIVNQVTKARVMAYRPIFDDWEITFTIDLDTAEGTAKTARELVDRAGRAIGLGVMRPSRKGPYGQFKVIKWIEDVEVSDTLKPPHLVAAE